MNAALHNLLKQPLLHFLLAGTLIFVAYSFEEPPLEADADRQIRVDQEALLNFMQYRAQAFNHELFAEQLRSLTPEQSQALIRDYVLEEALFREALDLGLDEGDYDIRLRLVQKMNFVLEDVAASQAEQMEPDETDLEQFYQQHAESYRVDPTYTFAHIFYSAEQHGAEQAREMALQLLPELRGAAVGFDAASNYGDRFRYLQTYIGRGLPQVINNFGRDFADQLNQLDPQTAVWNGPFASRLGWHLVLLTQRTESRIPPLDEVRDRVLEDYRYQALDTELREAEQQLVDKYEVILEDQ